jgi:putative ABC transport system permease protein
VTARLTSANSYTGFAAALQHDKRLGLSVSRERDYYEKVSNRLSSVISGLGSVVTFIFSFGAMLGAAITMYGAIGHRRREIGVLKALGFRSGHVLLAFLVEALSLALAGGALGVALAMLTPFLHFSAVNWATGQELAFRFLPQASILCIAVSAGAAVGVLGGFLPALSAARMDPVRAMRR